MLMEEDRFQSKNLPPSENYESLSLKKRWFINLRWQKKIPKTLSHKHFDTIVKGAIAVAFKIAGLILISFL